MHFYEDDPLEPQMIRQRVAAFKQALCEIDPEDRERMSELGDSIKKAKKARDLHFYNARQFGAFSSKLNAHKDAYELAVKFWREEEKNINYYEDELKRLNSKYPKLTEATLQVLEEVDDGDRVKGRNDRVSDVKDTIKDVFGIIVDYKYYD